MDQDLSHVSVPKPDTDTLPISLEVSESSYEVINTGCLVPSSSVLQHMSDTANIYPAQFENDKLQVQQPINTSYQFNEAHDEIIQVTNVCLMCLNLMRAMF